MKLFSITTAVLLLVGISSCKKDNTTEPTTNCGTCTDKGSLTIKIDHMVDTIPLALNTASYLNANGDTFTVSIFNYYISNIRLKSAAGNCIGGSEYVEPESYHLIEESVTGSKTFVINDIPAGEYETLEFILGVDSTRNVSGAQTGALDPVNGMFWSWNMGYIMAKFEGNSPSSTATNNKLTFHIGGFSGANNVIKTISPFGTGQKVIVSNGSSSMVHMMANVNEWWKNPATTDFSTNSGTTVPGATAVGVADNYSDMFSIHHITN